MLERLCRDLDRHLAEDPRGPGVARLLEEYARRACDWREFALFEASYYSRNLVHRTELYELIVLCWNVGQKSPIHDHAQQRCWMAVLEGTVRETIFRARAAGGPLAVSAVRSFPSGSVAYIVDEIGWHRIEPEGESAAVTLHLYSRPIAECRIFDETTQHVATRQLSYHSIRGRLTASPA